MGCQIPPYYITAYALAVKHGFKGTEAEWLESLQGVTPVLRIGQIKTLRVEEQAQVSIEGPPEAPVFHFGIPCLNDGINNQPVGIAAHVEGQDNIAGAKGFRVLGITPAGTNAGYNCYEILVDDARLAEKAAEAYAHADLVQWDAKQHHYGKLKIVGLTPGAAGSVITVEQTTKEEIDWGLDADPVENYIYVVGKNFGEVLPANVGIHVEGLNNIVTGKAAHSEGYKNKSIGNYSHTEGIGTLATDEAQHAGGKFNAPVSGPWVIGNGGGENSRSNAAQMDWDGNVRFDGDVIAFGCNGQSGVSLQALHSLVGKTSVGSQIQKALDAPLEKLYASNEAELEAALSGLMGQMADGSVKSFEVLPKRIVSEDFSDIVNEGTAITAIPTAVGDALAKWNGAAMPPNWSVWVSSGSVIVQPHIEDGNVCMKLTPRDTGGRLQMVYNVPSEVYESLVDGRTYRVSARYKGEGCNFNAQLEAKAASTWSVVPIALVDGEWVTAEYDFTVDKSRGGLSLTFGIAGPGGSQGSMYLDDICLVDVITEKPFVGHLYRANNNNAVARFATYGAAGNCLYDKTLYAGAWLPMKYSDGTDPDHSHDGYALLDHNHDGYALLDHNHDGSYLPKTTTADGLGAMTKTAEMYPYVSGDNDETRFNTWLDGLLLNMSGGQILPIRFSVYPAISGQTLSGFLFNHEDGYAEVLATTYLGAIYHKCRWKDRSPAWQPTICMNLINGTPADAGHTHDDRYYQPGGATVLTNQNWNQFVSVSGGGSAGMVREFDSGYLYRDEVKSHTFSYNSNLSKFYTIMISNDTDYSETGTTDDLYPISGSVSATTVDYMAIANVIAARKSLNRTEECEVWVPTSGNSVKVTITISGTTVTFKVDPTKCRFVNICGYY